MDDEFDDGFDAGWEDADLAGLEAAAVAEPVKPARPPQKPATYTQHNIFGKAVPAPPVAGPSRKPAEPKAVEPQQPKFTVSKEWDRATFKRVGWGTGADGKGKKAKGKAGALDPDDEFYDSYALDEEEVDHSRLYDDPELDPERPPPEMKLVYDEDAVQTFVYPLNKPKRDYQFNIVRRALFTNVLCALPTGLGKTFIAAVVMLNYYRWFPKGKIIFMAPTRPLVNQQIEACHAIAGIPASDAALITGQDQPANRMTAWQKRRVFYATPQTVVNDLKTGKLNPSEVICVVVDEAHKASGDYAYCGVVRYLMTKNPHFRLLALTATPGSKSEAVQSVVDNLHIGHIEIRSEESLDLRQYIHKKEVIEQIVPVSGDVASIRDGILEIMKPITKKCYGQGMIRFEDPLRLKPYAIQMAMKECRVKWGYPLLDKLRKLSAALGYLLEHSIAACLEDLGKCLSKKNTSDDQAIQQLIAQAKVCKMTPGYVPHPKMDALRTLLIDHFSKEESSDTRIMVFCHYRGVVEEIVECLNEQKPLIRASRFVGQGTDKAGGKGFGQKQQQETIKQFKEGKFNVLVATSIGEEGLDIGEVDLIVCYDSNKSPIRMLQRIGRTGRARQGKIVVLLTEGRDEQNWAKAQDNYATVQHAILSGKALELYADCERLLPKVVQPKPDMRNVDVVPFDHDALSLGAAAKRKNTGDAIVKGTKRKRDYAPEGAQLGFSTANELMTGVKRKPEPTLAEREAAACLTEEERSYLDRHWRRTEPDVEMPEQGDPPLGPVVRSRTGHSNLHARVRRALELGEQIEGSEDELRRWKKPAFKAFDEALIRWWNPDERGGGVRPYVACRPPKRSFFDMPSSAKFTATMTQSNKVASSLAPLPTLSNHEGQPLFAVPTAMDSDDDLPDASMALDEEPAPPPKSRKVVKKSFTPLIDLTSEDEEPSEKVPVEKAFKSSGEVAAAPAKTEAADAAPLLFAIGGLSSSPVEQRSPEFRRTPAVRAKRSPSPIAVPSSPAQPLSSPLPKSRSRSPVVKSKGLPAAPPLKPSQADDTFDFDDIEDDFDEEALAALDRAEARVTAKSEEGQLMPPPPVPSTTRKISSTVDSSKRSPVVQRPSVEAIETSSPGVVVPGRRAGQPRIIEDSDSSEQRASRPLRPLNGPKLVRAGEKRDEIETSSRDKEERPKKKRKKLPMQRSGLFDMEAVNSDESQEPSSEAFESENDSDRAFLDQTMTSDGGTDMRIYRESLGTQAPNLGFDPARKPGAFTLKYVGGYDPANADPDDIYERDSFCASDADDLEFNSSSQPLDVD